MRTWEGFKKDAKAINSSVKEDIEEMEALADIVSLIIERRIELGYSQKDLSELCGLSPSSISRIEACTVKPKVMTLIKIMTPLGLKLSVVNA